MTGPVRRLRTHLRGAILLSLITALAAATLVAGSGPAAAAVVPQSGPNPVVLDRSAATDDVVVLPAGSAQRPDTVTLRSYGQPKYAWVSGFDASGEYLSWRVSSTTTTQFAVSLLARLSASGQSMSWALDGTTVLTGAVPAGDFQRTRMGVLTIPAGEHVLTLRRATLSGSADVRSVELVATSREAARAGRAAAFAADTTRFRSHDYGLMFQYGGWGYPQSGTPKSLDQQAADFDVPAFVSMVRSTGAKYVIWSATWWTYELNAPITSVDGIVGNGNRTSSRDLIGDIARALDAAGVDFHLYYHTGQDSHLGYNSTDWWQRQAWPSTFTTTGTGDRSTFFANWQKVIAQIGTRYGTLLDGWFFDDGIVYYPAPFESLGQSARAGNPNRLVSFNGWETPSVTPFQDVAFGESCRAGNAPVGGDGRYVGSGEAGLQGHCMYRMEDDWGIRAANQSIGAANFTVDSADALVSDRVRRSVPTTFNLMMYENGAVSNASLSVLQGLKSRRAAAGASP